MSLLGLIPAPYGLLVRWLAIIGILVASFSYGYEKGLDHQQSADAVAHAKQVEQADQVRLAQDASTRKILTNREDKIRELENQKPAVRDVIHTVCLRDSAIAAPRPELPGHAGGTGLQPSGSPDRALPGYTEADQAADINECRQVIVDYRALRAAWHANERHQQ